MRLCDLLEPSVNRGRVAFGDVHRQEKDGFDTDAWDLVGHSQKAEMGPKIYPIYLVDLGPWPSGETCR